MGDSAGGVLDEDLRSAALSALHVPRSGPLARARRFDWQASCAEFLSFLVPAHAVANAGIATASGATHDPAG